MARETLHARLASVLNCIHEIPVIINYEVIVRHCLHSFFKGKEILTQPGESSIPIPITLFHRTVRLPTDRLWNDLRSDSWYSQMLVVSKAFFKELSFVVFGC